MTTLRRLLLTALPKVALSRACGWLASTPLPGPLRPVVYGWFARRYGAALDEMAGDLRACRSLQHFFRRGLRPGVRPVAAAPLVWPCDGRIVTVGPVRDGRIPQVKGNDYALADLLGDADWAGRFEGGCQATIYLAPGDYHRVHAPFAATIEAVTALPGTLFPVNPPSVRCIDRLFVRNSRHVFRCRLPSGGAAAVVMVGAYNVGGTTVTQAAGSVHPGDELGQFGFGSTVVVVLGADEPRFAELAAESRVRMGAAATPPGAPA
ncbi:MAG: phosphatidylserine decarboxylase [Planctomycetes bacterium]|nr:phosphatidylserine decarboxylase [Planctomycetota bacterium]